MNRWPGWAEKRDLITGVFVSVFVGSLAALVALWLVTAVIVGTAEIVGRIR